MPKVKYLIDIHTPFNDKVTGEPIQAGTIFETDDPERARNIIEVLKLGFFAGVKHPKRKGKRILIHQKYCYKIGGIETANYNIATTFKDRNIVFVFGSADQDQMLRLAKYHDVIIDNGSRTYDCDVAIFTNYDSAPEIMDRVNAKKVYQQIHADFYALKQMDAWRNFAWTPNPRIDKVLSVSETAQKGLQRAFGIESVVVPNLLPKVNVAQPLVFIALTRATPEKGVNRLVNLLKRFNRAGKDYILFLCATIDQAQDSDQEYLRDNPRVVQVTPTAYSPELLRGASWLVQLSYNESYCYSVRQALQYQVPCLVSDCPELKKVIKNGKNGYIYSDDFDIDKLWNEIPKFEPYEEKISPLWEKVMEGEL